MASPVGSPAIQGNGPAQLKAQILAWVRAEIRDSRRAGIGIAPQAVYDSTTNFALTTGLGALRTTTITVPSGMTSAAVTVTGRVYAINPNTTGGADAAGADYLTAQSAIAGNTSLALPILAKGSSGSTINVAPVSTVLTGLVPGSTFTLTVSAKTQYASWATNAANTVDVSGQILWFR